MVSVRSGRRRPRYERTRRRRVVAQRTAPQHLPAGVSFRRCDALDADPVRGAVAGLRQVVLAIGFPYVGALWREAWPRAMTNFIEACAATGARLVFVDNLYMYGPQTAPLRETTPLTPHGLKPAARVDVTQIRMAASEAGRLRVVALRVVRFLWSGGRAIPSRRSRVRRARERQSRERDRFARHAARFRLCPRFRARRRHPARRARRRFRPSMAPALRADRSPREILALGAAALGVKPRVSGLPLWTLGPLGLFVPVLREMREMRFQWDRPYRVDFEPLRQSLLGRRDAVRSRRAGDGAVVSRSRRRALAPALISPARTGRKRERRPPTYGATRCCRRLPARPAPSRAFVGRAKSWERRQVFPAPSRPCPLRASQASRRRERRRAGCRSIARPVRRTWPFPSNRVPIRDTPFNSSSSPSSRAMVLVPPCFLPSAFSPGESGEGNYAAMSLAR